MKQSKRKKMVEEQFEVFMSRAIGNCIPNAARKVAGRRGIGRIPLEDLDDGRYDGAVAFFDHYGDESEIEVERTSFKVRIDNEILSYLFDGPTDREKQALILRVGFDYSYEEIGEILGIEPGRAKDYKYQALRKAKNKEDERKRKQSGL